MDFAIRTKLAVLTTLLIGAIAVFIFLFFPARLEDQAFDALVAKAQSIAGMTAFNIGPALFFDDIPTIEEALKNAQQNKDLAYLVVLDIQGRLAAAFRKDRADQAEFTSTEKEAHLSRDGAVYMIVEPVEFDGREIGRLCLGLSLAELHSEINRIRATVALVSLAIFVIGMVAVFGISTVITGPLSQIVGTVEQISQGDLNRRAAVSSRDEVSHLASSFNLMVDRLQSVYSELEYINQNLEKRVHERTTDLQKEVADHKRTEELNARLYQELLNAHEHLQQTQDKLIEGEKLRVLGEMVAMIAHEVRNPLGAIENCLAVLRSHPQLEHRYTEMVELTQGEVSRLNKLVKDLLIFGKPGIPEFVQVDLAALAEEVVRVVKQDAEFPPDLELSCAYPANLPPFKGDPTQMRQLVLNLVTNAVEACKEGGQVSLTLEAGPGQHRIVVQDSGVGIPTDVQPQIFEPFYTTRSRGTGLGLAVVHRIVEIHRGHIDIRSTGRKNAAVKGTSIVVSLPWDDEHGQHTDS